MILITRSWYAKKEKLCKAYAIHAIDEKPVPFPLPPHSAVCFGNEGSHVGVNRNLAAETSKFVHLKMETNAAACLC